MAKKEQDPTKIFVKTKTLPTSLLSDPIKENKVRLLEVETYKVNCWVILGYFWASKQKKKGESQQCLLRVISLISLKEIIQCRK